MDSGCAYLWLEKQQNKRKKLHIWLCILDFESPHYKIPGICKQKPTIKSILLWILLVKSPDSLRFKATASLIHWFPKSFFYSVKRSEVSSRSCCPRNEKLERLCGLIVSSRGFCFSSSFFFTYIFMYFWVGVIVKTSLMFPRVFGNLPSAVCLTSRPRRFFPSLEPFSEASHLLQRKFSPLFAGY